MKLHLTLLSLSANLPHPDSSISFQLREKHHRNPLSDDLNCHLDQQPHLEPTITEMIFSETQLLIEVENPEEPKIFDLSVLATTTSNSQIVLLGKVEIDTQKLLSQQIQKVTSTPMKKCLLGVNNQKGTLTFEIHTVEPNFQENLRNVKSFEQLDKEQTCSSDSYEANLKDLNKITNSDECDDFSPKFKQSLQNPFRNVELCQRVIMEEIDLEDDENDEFYHNENSLSDVFSRNSFKTQNPVDKLKAKLIQERLRIAIEMHNLQESDFFLMRMGEKITMLTQ